MIDSGIQICALVSPLAARAEMRAAVRECDPLDRSAAPRARLTLASVGVQRVRKISRLPQ